MGIGGIQNGFYVVDVVFDLFGEQLGCAENITAQVSYQKTAD